MQTVAWGALARGALGVAGPHVHRHSGDLRAALGAELLVELVADLRAGAFGAPDDLAALVIADQGQVAMALAPGDLVDADLEQLVEAVGVELLGADTLGDPPDGGPVDAQHPLDRRLVRPGGQPRHQALEVAREVRAVTREADALDADAVLRTGQSAQPGADLQAPDAEIEMAPAGIDRAHVMAMGGRERAQRADQPSPAQGDLHYDAVGLKADIADVHPVKAQQG